MESILDLPAHPLLVHFPIIAIPVLTLLGLVSVISSRFRQRYGRAILILAVVTTIATIMAAHSGEAFVETLDYDDDYIETHAALGETLRIFVLGLTITYGGLLAVRKRSESTGRDPLSIGVSLLVVVFAVLSVVWTIRTGHEGAKSVWGSVELSSDSDETDEVITSAPSTTVPSTTAPSTTTAPTTESSTTDVVPTSDGLVVETDGQTIYTSKCVRCHGATGAGGKGPSLEGLTLELPDKAVAVEQVVEGEDGMPAFGARLSAEEIAVVVDYVYATF